MDKRMQFIARVLAGEDEMMLCRQYGISRKTGYKWLGRYISQGAAGLAERSHAPLQHGQAHWLVRFADVELGYIHPKRRRLSPRPLRGVSKPGDLMEIAGAIPTTPPAQQLRHP